MQRLKAQKCDLEVDAVVVLSNITVKEYVVLNIRQNTERKENSSRWVVCLFAGIQVLNLY